MCNACIIFGGLGKKRRELDSSTIVIVQKICTRTYVDTGETTKTPFPSSERGVAVGIQRQFVFVVESEHQLGSLANLPV